MAFALRFWPTIGGVGTSASNLLPALCERGYEFVVVTSKDYSDLPEEDHFKGIPVYRFPFWSSLAKGNVNQIIELRRRITQLKQTFLPDLVHIGFLGGSVVFHLHTINTHPSPLLVSMDSTLPDQELGRDSLAARTARDPDFPRRDRHSTTIFFASMYPSSRRPCRKASVRSVRVERGATAKNPIRGTFFGCCADTLSRPGCKRIFRIEDNKFSFMSWQAEPGGSGLAFSPDSKTLATSADDDNIKLWTVD